ncbi:MAG TPA: DinB family protein [Abditibacteriaceae bacterium]|jgi:hypothetical protein
MTQDLIIALLESGRDGLTRTAQAVPEDKLTWKPLDNGRTVLDVLGEAAQTSKMVTQMVLSNGEEMPSREAFQQMRAERADWDREKCLQELQTNSNALIEAIGTKTEEQLAKPIYSPMGGGMTQPLAFWSMMAYRTFMSRTAQINYIQTLYGDFESH